MNESGHDIIAAPVLSTRELKFIAEAADYLEHPSLLVTLTNLVGRPIEFGIERLPVRVKEKISSVTKKVLEKSLELSLKTLPARAQGSFELGEANSARTDWKHTALSAGTGIMGGFFGLPGLFVELPVTTGVMMRSIASIAADYGHDPLMARTKLECLSVLAMGSPSKADDELDGAYIATRAGMAKLIRDASFWLAGKTASQVAKSIAEGSAPILVRFIARVAARFEVTISEKALAVALPGLGAITGAAINAAFTDHYNAVARYHFGMRALEAAHGEEAVLGAYKAAHESARMKRLKA